MTISRQCGAGIDRISRELIEYLDAVDESGDHGWALFDQSLIAHLIENNSLPRSGPAFLPGKAKFPVSTVLSETLNQPADQWSLFHYSAAAIRILCRLGNTVVVGRAGNFVTADLPNTFHVRLVGSEEKRVAHIAERYGISHDDARNVVRETDKARASFVERYADSSIDAAHSYHLVLNTDDLRDEVLVRVLADSLLEWARVTEHHLVAAV